MKTILLVLVLSASLGAQSLDLESRHVCRANVALFEVPELASPLHAATARDDDFGLGHFSIGVSVGLMLDPVGFGANIEGDAWLLPFFAVGSRLSLGVSGDTFFLGFAPIVKGVAPLPLYERMLLYAFVGPGFAYVSHSGGEQTDSEVGFLLTFGTGIDVHFARWFSLGGGISFNWLVTRPADEGFTWMLEFVRFRLHF